MPKVAPTKTSTTEGFIISIIQRRKTLDKFLDFDIIL